MHLAESHDNLAWARIGLRYAASAYSQLSTALHFGTKDPMRTFLCCSWSFHSPDSGRPKWGCFFDRVICGRPFPGARDHACCRDGRLTRSFARVTAGALLDLLQDLTEVVALRRLQRWELLVRRQVLQPQLLADRQHVPVILERCCRCAER